MFKKPAANGAKVTQAGKPDNKGGGFGKILKSLSSRKKSAAAKAAGRGKRSI